MRITTTRAAAPRRAFTLLELIVTLGLSVLLLAALYVAMDVLFTSQTRGRGLSEHSAAVRSLLGRIEKDILSELPPLDPRQNPTASQMLTGVTPGGGGGGSTSGSGGGTSGGGGGTSGGGGGTSGGGGGMSSTGSASGGGGSSGSGGSATTSVTTGTGVGTNGPVVFNFQLQGTSTQLTLYTSQVPTDMLRYLAGNLGNQGNNQDQPITSDLRRITYWLAGDSSSPLGLARQELKVATSQDALTPFDPSQVDAKAFVIAKEVLNLTFEYFDGSQWQTSWDGTVVQSDNITPQGPPAAVRISLTVRRANATSDDQRVTYRHVVAIPTANNFLTTASGSSTGSTSSSQGGMSP